MRRFRFWLANRLDVLGWRFEIVSQKFYNAADNVLPLMRK